jgi:hypothetical protein
MENKLKIIIIILIIICLILGNKSKNYKEESESNLDVYYECKVDLFEANISIEAAKSSAWSSYENMGSALEDLEPIY